MKSELHNALTDKDKIINEMQMKILQQSKEIEELMMELNQTKRKSQMFEELKSQNDQLEKAVQALWAEKH